MTASRTYDIGDAPVLTITCTSIADALTDPTTLIVEVEPAGGTKVTYTYGSSPELTRTSVGLFALALPAFTTSGRREVYAKGTGALIAAEQSAFLVRAKNTT